MANPEHVAVVKKGAAAIEEWRQKNPGEVLLLSNADLSGLDLSKSILLHAILKGADLSYSNLSESYLGSAFLSEANLSHVNMVKAKAPWAHLCTANFSEALLSGADFFQADFSSTNLSRADFSGAYLGYATFMFTKFLATNLSNVNLWGAKLLAFDVSGVNLTGAIMSYTTFARCNLAHGIGLETIKHEGPSNIDVSTLTTTFRESGNRLTPELETFFLNAGVSKELLEALPRILAEVQFCTCFVCYGQPDLGFASRLVRDLKARGVSCWLYSMDYTPGRKVWGEIIQRRQEAEKMIVLCSAKALIRDGVLKEIEEQIDEDPDKIVPISLDDTWKEIGFPVKRGQRDLKPFLLERNYADFSDDSKYEASLNRLLKGIKRNKK